MKLTTYNIEHMESAIKKIKKLQKKIDKELATKFTAQERALIDLEISVEFKDDDFSELAMSAVRNDLSFRMKPIATVSEVIQHEDNGIELIFARKDDE